MQLAMTDDTKLRNGSYEQKWAEIDDFKARYLQQCAGDGYITRFRFVGEVPPAQPKSEHSTV